MKIFWKLTLLCTVLVVTSSFILAYFTNDSFRSTLKEEIINSLSTQTQTVGSTIENFVIEKSGNQNNTNLTNLVTAHSNSLDSIVNRFRSSGIISADLTLTMVHDNGTILFSDGPAAENPMGKFSVFEDIRSSLSGNKVGTYEGGETIHLAVRQTSSGTLANVTFFMISTVSQENVFASLGSFQSQIGLIVGVVILVGIVLSVIIANVFVGPIVKLSKAASEIASGEGNFNLDIQSNDEVGVLAKQLSMTSQTLHKRLEEQKMLYDRMQEQKIEIEKVNVQLTDSISYSQRIQNSMLPDPRNLKRVVKDIMVYYKPRDIVSGDFYWFERVRQGRNEFLIIACADCTGHGVPGAIMSIMGSNQLTNIVYYQNNLDPQKILARLDKAIKLELYRDTKKDETRKEGMEIGVCVLNLDENILEFAGVGIPLYILKDGNLQTIKAIKEMVGDMDGEERDVENRLKKSVIQCEKGDRFYMATDGFQDQFGGPEDKKFLSRNLRDLFIKFADTPLKHQAKEFDVVFKDWVGNGPQTDDIQIVAFEV